MNCHIYNENMPADLLLIQHYHWPTGGFTARSARSLLNPNQGALPPYAIFGWMAVIPPPESYRLGFGAKRKTSLIFRGFFWLNNFPN